MLIYETFLRSHTISEKQAIQFSGICAYHYGDGMNFHISDYDKSKDYEGKYGNGYSLIAKADNISELHKKIINYFQKWDKEKSPYENFPYEVWAKKQLEHIV
ncbi:hypothetical protein FACS1894178_9390 [Bacteroidia bacterium]|nr:hypothetical protein FACS1894178_9390 [Bacteroidia bacterium]